MRKVVMSSQKQTQRRPHTPRTSFIPGGKPASAAQPHSFRRSAARVAGYSACRSRPDDGKIVTTIIR